MLSFIKEQCKVHSTQLYNNDRNSWSTKFLDCFRCSFLKAKIWLFFISVKVSKIIWSNSSVDFSESFVFLRAIQMCDDLANFVTGRERDQSRVQQTRLRQQRIHHKRCEKKTKKSFLKAHYICQMRWSLWSPTAIIFLATRWGCLG